MGWLHIAQYPQFRALGPALMSRPSAHPSRRSKGGRQTHKDYCKKERRNKPKKNKKGKPTWCKYCADKRAGKPSDKWDHHGCKRVTGTCEETKVLAPRGRKRVCSSRASRR